MADEPRRSGRATKGQHTKNDTPEPSGKKGKRGRKKAQKQKSEEPEPEEEDAIIRCVCGYEVEDPKDKRAMICCDTCQAWQHNVHMGLSEDDDEMPDQYFCEQCKPEDHKELLESMARGEQLWDTREAEAKAAKLASRKRGKGGRKSTVAEKETAPTQPELVATPKAELKQEAGQKRKAPPDASPGTPVEAAAPGSKVRRVNPVTTEHRPNARRQSTANDSIKAATGATPLQMELVEKVSDLRDETRRNVATAFLKLFTSSAKSAIQAGSFKVPAGQDLPTFALKLTMNVEYAMYLNLWGHGATAKPDYGMQLRAILHNVKQNDQLRDRILNGGISPNDLSMMQSEEMASDELRQKTAEMKKKVEAQSILVQDQAPLIRRTHKGEELVEKQGAGLDGSGEDFRPAKRRSNASADNDDRMSDRDRAESPEQVELPEQISKPRPAVDIRKLSIDTKRRTSHSGRKSSATFDVDKVWSSVESPGTPARPTPASAHRPTSSIAKADPEIDRLLKDENEDDEEYSPADYTPDPDIIWGGTVQMATIAEFRATAKYAAGANLSEAYPWDQLMPGLLAIEGRIDVTGANNYLCGLQWSKATDLTVVQVLPADHTEDRDAFNRLFEYFTERDRYGVIRRSPVAAARDIYVIPLEAGTGKQPEFMELLAENVVESSRRTRTLLIAYVLKCTPKGEADQSQSATPVNAPPATPVQPQHPPPTPQQQQGQHFRTSSVSQQMSPSAPTPPQAGHPTIPPNPYAQSPPAGSPAFVPPHQVPSYPVQYQAQPNGNGGAASGNGGGGGGGGGNLTGMAAAIHILGEMANSRAITELLQQSPNVGINELGHIKDVFTEMPETRSSLSLLIPRLQEKIKKSG